MSSSVLLPSIFICFISALYITRANSSLFEKSNAKTLSVKGRLVCGKAPAVNVKAVLFPKDAGSGPDPPDQLGETHTDSDGKFQISGTTTTDIPIDAVLKFYHSCNNNKHNDGLRKVSVKIPNDYVTNGRVSLKPFNTGTINLELGFPGEERQK